MASQNLEVKRSFQDFFLFRITCKVSALTGFNWVQLAYFSISYKKTETEGGACFPYLLWLVPFTELRTGNNETPLKVEQVSRKYLWLCPTEMKPGKLIYMDRALWLVTPSGSYWLLSHVYPHVPGKNILNVGIGAKKKKKVCTGCSYSQRRNRMLL